MKQEDVQSGKKHASYPPADPGLSVGVERSGRRRGVCFVDAFQRTRDRQPCRKVAKGGKLSERARMIRSETFLGDEKLSIAIRWNESETHFR